MDDPGCYADPGGESPPPEPAAPQPSTTEPAPLPEFAERERLTSDSTEGAFRILEENIDCFNHLSPVDNDRRDGNLNPVTVMSSVKIDFFDDGSNDYAGAPFKAGTTGFVVLFPNFYRPLSDPFKPSFFNTAFQFDLSQITLTRPISDSEIRILIVLHEVGHLTGENARHTAGDEGQRFNNGILVHCLRAAQFR
jgi:hypothetical protein